MSNREIRILLKFLDEACSSARELMPRLLGRNVTDVELATICMHLRTINLASGVSALLHANSTAGVPILYRALLEVFVDLWNILECGTEYFDECVTPADLEVQIRILKAAGRGNEILEVIREAPDFASTLEQLKLKQTSLKDHVKAKNKGKKLGKNVRDCFEKAGMLDEYESVYVAVCESSHSNLHELHREHVTRCNDGSIQLHLSGDERYGNREFFLRRTVDHCMDSTIKTHEHFRTGCDDVLHELRVKQGLMIDRLANPNRKSAL